MGALFRLKALETPIVFDNLDLLRGSLTGLFMVRIWRFSRQKRCIKSDTRMTKSVTPTARSGLKGLQGAEDILTENIWRFDGNLTQGL